MALTIIASIPWGRFPFIFTYLIIEIAFFISYHVYILPRANRRTEPHPYRDYGNDRLCLLNRILSRLEKTCKHTGDPFYDAVNDLIMNWFYEMDCGNHFEKESTPPPLKMISSLSPSPSFSDGPAVRRRKKVWGQQQDDTSFCCSSDEEDEEKKATEPNVGALPTPHPVLQRDNVEDFLGWAFFAKSPSAMLPWEQVELGRLCHELENQLNNTFQPGRNPGIEAKRMTMENVNSLHRPLLVYAAVWLLRLIASATLWAVGFRRYKPVDGPGYWYRPSFDTRLALRSPLLFFHGISPGGYVVYLPMILWGLGNDGKAIFLFENNPISCCPVFTADTEDQTVQAVTDAVNRHIGHDVDVTLCGHSFGSCPITWLIRSTEFRSRIQQIVLMDPVTILLHEPDVVDNFLYGKRAGGNPIVGAVIRLAASSELFTNQYLRRHFAWYNSELWLEDLPSQTRVTVCISEKDDIINAKKVKSELDIHRQTLSRKSSCSRLDVIEWEGAGHGYCVTTPSTWAEIRETMKL